MTKKFTDNDFPSFKEIEEITQKVSAPDYPYTNYVLPENANNHERIKFSLCQNILRYKRENNLSEPELTKKIGISKDKLIDILFNKVHNLNLEELLNYADNLHLPLEIRVIEKEPSKISTS